MHLGPTLVTLPWPLLERTSLATLVCPVVRTPLSMLFMGTMWLWRAALFATVTCLCIPCLAQAEMTEAITATLVDGLLPGTVFLGMRTPTLPPLNVEVLTFSLVRRVTIYLRVTAVDLPTILFRPFARSIPFPLGASIDLTQRTLLLILAYVRFAIMFATLFILHLLWRNPGTLRTPLMLPVATLGVKVLLKVTRPVWVWVTPVSSPLSE